jgi:hypothetical protein
MHSNNVIILNGSKGNSSCRSPRVCVALPSKTTTTHFESYVALDQYLEPQRDTSESRIGFEGIVGWSAALSEVVDQIRTVAPGRSKLPRYPSPGGNCGYLHYLG